MKAETSDRQGPTSQSLMPGMRFHAGKPWRITVDTIDVLRAAFGDELLNALIRCLAAADRLMTIVDCMTMNGEQLAHGSVRRDRNHNVLSLFSVGLVYELREGLQQLRAAKIDRRLTPAGLEQWANLVKFADLENEDVLCQIRNCVAFHLGDRAVVARGIERLSSMRRELVVITADTGSQIEAQHDFATDVVLSGLRVRPRGVPKGTANARRPLDVEEAEAAFSEASDDHLALLRSIDEIMMDLLRQGGASYLPLDHDEPSAKE